MLLGLLAMLLGFNQMNVNSEQTITKKATVKLPSPQEVSDTLDFNSLKFKNNKFSHTNLQRMSHLKINTEKPYFQKNSEWQSINSYMH